MEGAKTPQRVRNEDRNSRGYRNNPATRSWQHCASIDMVLRRDPAALFVRLGSPGALPEMIFLAFPARRVYDYGDGFRRATHNWNEHNSAILNCPRSGWQTGVFRPAPGGTLSRSSGRWITQIRATLPFATRCRPWPVRRESPGPLNPHTSPCRLRSAEKGGDARSSLTVLLVLTVTHALAHFINCGVIHSANNVVTPPALWVPH